MKTIFIILISISIFDSVVQTQDLTTVKSCGDNKTCVPFYQCKNKSNDVQIIIKFDEPGVCEHYLEVCCLNDEKITDPIVSTPKPLVDFHNTCGSSNKDGLGFKITGNKETVAEYGEFPWMIEILNGTSIGREFNYKFICGGSLIHPRVVLTAAFCVTRSKAHDLLVRAGEWDLQTRNEIYREQDRQVTEIVIHENYNGRQRGSIGENVIALLVTSEPFTLSSYINTVCLPPPNFNFDNNRCFATGWGYIDIKTRQTAEILKKIEMPIVPTNTCQEILKNILYGERIHESFICAGGETGKDTCSGDSGGPLNCPIPGQKDRFYQAGIVAWGVGCGGEVPGGYVNVAYLRDWIDSVMESKKFDSTYYTAL